MSQRQHQTVDNVVSILRQVTRDERLAQERGLLVESAPPRSGHPGDYRHSGTGDPRACKPARRKPVVGVGRLLRREPHKRGQRRFVR